jgi:hypothetical protein
VIGRCHARVQRFPFEDKEGASGRKRPRAVQRG